MDAVKSNRLIVSSTVIACGMLDTSRFKSRAELDQALLRAAEQAFSLRDLLAVRRAAEALLFSSDRRAQSAARYYLAWIDKREGRSDAARRTLSNLISDPSAIPSYRARAYRTLALIEQESSNPDAAMGMYREAAILSAKGSDYLNLGLSLIATATLTTDCGDYGKTIELLRKAAPVIEHVSLTHPLYKFVLFNNAAEALMHIGRIEEARRFAYYALASPFAKAYPEWLETAQEIEQQVQAGPVQNRNVRPALKLAQKTTPKSKLRRVEKLWPVALHASTRRIIGLRAIIRPEQPRSRPMLKQICIKIKIRAPSF